MDEKQRIELILSEIHISLYSSLRALRLCEKYNPTSVSSSAAGGE
jgi:hypothetical protein